jgi:hypothetical protein
MPSWQVSVNGLPTPILPAPRTTSIPVPANIAPYFMPSNFQPHHVELRNPAADHAQRHAGPVVRRGARQSPVPQRKHRYAAAVAGQPAANRPYNGLIPQISTINYRGSNGDSHYNGLQAKVTAP